jgi:hypothetical protein
MLPAPAKTRNINPAKVCFMNALFMPVPPQKPFFHCLPVLTPPRERKFRKEELKAP